MPKIRISNIENLDPISVFLEEGGGGGRITIECSGQSWSLNLNFTPNKTFSEFLCSCEKDYLIFNLCNMFKSNEPDYEAFLPLVRGHILRSRRDMIISRETARYLYEIDDWEIHAATDHYFYCPDGVDGGEFGSLYLDDIVKPTKKSHRYCYMERIVGAVQDALRQIRRNVGNTDFSSCKKEVVLAGVNYAVPKGTGL